MSIMFEPLRLIRPSLSFIIIVIYFSLIQYIPTAAFPPSTPPTPPPHFSLREEKISKEHKPYMTHDKLRPCTNPLIKAGRGNPVGGMGSEEQSKYSETPLFPLLGVKPKHQANNRNMLAENLAQNYAGSTIVTSVSGSPHEPCLVAYQLCMA